MPAIVSVIAGMAGSYSRNGYQVGILHCSHLQLSGLAIKADHRNWLFQINLTGNLLNAGNHIRNQVI